VAKPFIPILMALTTHWNKKKKRTSTGSLKTEMGDVLFALICIADSYNISLEEALNDTLAKYKKRDKNR